MFDLVFLACAIGEKYEEFLIPFTFFALVNNPNAFVEMVVIDREKFIEKYDAEIAELSKSIGNLFDVRNFSMDLNNNIPNTYRFFEIPENKGRYTYIVDIDIMIMENVLPIYLENWPDKNIPYNNIIRKDSQRLTGIQMVRTGYYYSKKFRQEIKNKYNENKNINDEHILYKMCEASHGLIDINFNWRPILGIHFSPNRGIGKQMSWKTNVEYYKKFYELKEKYPQYFKFKCFKNLMEDLEYFEVKGLDTTDSIKNLSQEGKEGEGDVRVEKLLEIKNNKINSVKGFELIKVKFS